MGKQDPFSSPVALKFHELGDEFRPESARVSHLPLMSYAAEPFSAVCKCMNELRHCLFRKLRGVCDKENDRMRCRIDAQTAFVLLI